MNFETKTTLMGIAEMSYRFSFMNVTKTETYARAFDTLEAFENNAHADYAEGTHFVQGRDAIVSFQFLGTYESVTMTAKVSHGIADNMGRELGHEFSIINDCYYGPKGWTVRRHATRAGKLYGASHRGVLCATLAQAVVLCEELAAKGKKAAVKAATRGGRKS